MIKVAILAPYPVARVLPERYLKPRIRQSSKLKHPAPWVRALCREFSAKNGIEIEVISHNNSITQIHRAVKEGIKFTFVPKYEPARSDPFHLYLPAMLQVRPLIKQFNPDIVHGFGTEGGYGLLAVNQGKPSVLFIQGIQEKNAPYYDMPKIKIVFRKALERYAVSKADGLIAETDFARLWAQSVSPGIKVKIIPHGYTDTFFHGSPDFKRRRMVCIGTMSRLKGCTKVLEAFGAGFGRNPELFKHSELVFIGRGPLEEFLIRSAKNYGINDHVYFNGGLDHQEIVHELKKACFLVIGSRMDTSPNVITEAHVVGIPVIGTTAGGIPEMIEDGEDGFLVPVDDVERMSQRMEILLSDLDLAAEMGRAGREKVRKLNDPSRVADEHIAFYEEILAESRK